MTKTTSKTQAPKLAIFVVTHKASPRSVNRYWVRMAADLESATAQARELVADEGRLYVSTETAGDWIERRGAAMLSAETLYAFLTGLESSEAQLMLIAKLASMVGDEHIAQTCQALLAASQVASLNPSMPLPPPPPSR